MSNEFERIWREMTVTQFDVLSQHLTIETEDTNKSGRLVSGWNLNQELPEYETGVPASGPWRSQGRPDLHGATTTFRVYHNPTLKMDTVVSQKRCNILTFLQPTF
jgi:hypothetical protein